MSPREKIKSILCKDFNTTLFGTIMKSYDADPYTTKTELEKYLNAYPNDYVAKEFYVSVLIRICDFEKAKEIHKAIFEMIMHNDLEKSKKRISKLKRNLINNEAKLLYVENEYYELAELSRKYAMYFDEKTKKSINYIIGDADGIYPYKFRQMHNYNINEFYEHIKKHLYGSGRSNAIFNREFKYFEVLGVIKEHIPSDKCLYNGFFEDTYYFKYDNCGTVDGVSTDYFKILCCHKSSKIITMLPVVNATHLPVIDINGYQIKKPIKTKNYNIDKYKGR